jgi:hypothetical protein
MPALTTLTVNDRATTPVAHVFTPRSLADGVTTLAETTGVPTGEKTFTISKRKSGTNFKCKLNFKYPVMVSETINGVVRQSVERTSYGTVELTFAETSSTQERKDTIGMIADSLAASKVIVNDTFVNLEDIW